MLFTTVIATVDPTPAPTATDIGSLVIGIAFILLVIERIASLVRLFWPHKQVNGDYATTADIIRLEERLGILTNDYKELVKTAFDHYDIFNKTIADLRVGQEVLRREIGQEVVKATESVLMRIDRAEKVAADSHHKHSQE